MSGQPYLCKWKNRPRFTLKKLHDIQLALSAQTDDSPLQKRLSLDGNCQIAEYL